MQRDELVGVVVDPAPDGLGQDDGQRVLRGLLQVEEAGAQLLDDDAQLASVDPQVGHDLQARQRGGLGVGGAICQRQAAGRARGQGQGAEDLQLGLDVVEDKRPVGGRQVLHDLEDGTVQADAVRSAVVRAALAVAVLRAGAARAGQEAQLQQRRRRHLVLVGDGRDDADQHVQQMHDLRVDERSRHDAVVVLHVARRLALPRRRSAGARW